MTVSSEQPGSFRRLLQDRYIGKLWQNYFGSRMLTTLGLLWDTLSQTVTDAFAAPLHRAENGPAYDAVRLLGNETSMPQYPFETWEAYRSRLRTDWDTWSKAGDEDTITGQLALAGRPGAQIFRFSDNGSWSEFVVFYPAGTHPVTGDRTYGSGLTYGGSSTYGVAGITAEELAGYKDLITHWKPARWKCPWIIWEISGATYGTGHTYGEAGLTYGGEQQRTQVQA